MFKINKKRGYISVLLSLIVFLICTFDYSWKAGLLFSIFFLIVGFIDVDNTNKKSSIIVIDIWTCTVIFLTAYLSQFLMDYNTLISLGVLKIIITFLIVFSCVQLLYSITNNQIMSVNIVSFVLLLLVTINHYVYLFRGNELCPMDLISTQTAINVINQYHLEATVTVAYSWIIWTLLFFSSFSLPKIESKKGIYNRLRSFLITFGCVFILLFSSKDLTVESFGKSGTIKNGFYLNFFLQLRDAYVQKPDQYSHDFIDKLEKEYPAEKESSIKDTPNIIVIMDESFADLSVLGNSIQTSSEVTPFIDHLSNNTVKGYALSSIFGGKTPNSEFEFLTGNTMAFLPKGSIPYQQYIHNEKYSIVSYLKSLGYYTVGTHPFHSNGWKRDNIYRLLGFDKVTFEEDYPKKDLIKGLVSDQEMFEYISHIYEQKPEGEKIFLFGVTMQNHGGYETTSDFNSTISLQGYNKDYSDVEQYLSLINLTDSSLKYLIEYFSEISEKTVVLIFGDHLPNLDPDFFEEVHGKKIESLEEQVLQYKIPFLIWANYDIPEQIIDLTSINYLSNYVFEVAGIDLPPYNRFLHAIQNQYGAMNQQVVYSKETEAFLPIKNAMQKDEMLKSYSILQYNSLFDQNRSAVFFP